MPAPRVSFARAFSSRLSLLWCATQVPHGRRVGLVSCPTGFYARICICIWICVFGSACLSLISVRSACICLSEEELDIAVLVHDDAGSRYALLRLVKLFLVLPEPAKPYGYTFFISSGNYVFGIEKPSILGACRRCRQASSARVRTLEPAALSPLPCPLIHNL